MTQSCVVVSFFEWHSTQSWVRVAHWLSEILMRFVLSFSLFLLHTVRATATFPFFNFYDMEIWNFEILLSFVTQRSKIHFTQFDNLVKFLRIYQNIFLWLLNKILFTINSNVCFVFECECIWEIVSSVVQYCVIWELHAVKDMKV